MNDFLSVHREILRMHREGMSHHGIGEALHLNPRAVFQVILDSQNPQPTDQQTDGPHGVSSVKQGLDES
jgi:hypothetical protein